MAKGFWTQGFAVLLDKAVSLDEIAPLLRDFEIARRVNGGEGWEEMGGETLILSFRPEVNGFVTLDVVNRPWPDTMGDSQTEIALFGAWSMGFFGPLTFPGNLARAVEQSQHWNGAATVAKSHRAFIRVRCSYILGADSDALVMPPDYDSLGEVNFLSRVAANLLEIPAALAYFNPGGEILLSRDDFNAKIEHDAAHDLPPFDAWVGVRLFRLRDGWTLMDSVGMQQFDAPDHEACFPSRFEPRKVAEFLRNSSLYRWENGDVLRDGHTADDFNGVRWCVRGFAESLAAPPRPVLRWVPDDERALLPEFGFEAPPNKTRRGWWGWGKP